MCGAVPRASDFHVAIAYSRLGAMRQVEVPIHSDRSSADNRAKGHRHFMHSPVTVNFRHLERSGALEARLREMGERLQRYSGGATRCRVTVEGGLEGGQEGARYSVSIHLSAPGAQIHADSVQHDGSGHRDVFEALRDAYGRARRQLQDLKRERQSSRLSGARG
jgi:putative sigma-54 modulation protein